MLDIATIVLIIQLSDPTINTKTANYYAKAIYGRQVALGVDPFDVVAIIKHESHWNSRLISEDLKDFGLMQVRSQHVNVPPSLLLDGYTNIRVGCYLISISKKFCKEYLHRESNKQEWLSTYQGSRHFCKKTNLAYKVEDYSRCLYDSMLDQTDYNCNSIYKSYKYDGNYPIKL